MDTPCAGNDPPPDASAQPATSRLPDDIVRKQQALRRHLQDPASPAFNDPVRAAELAGFPVMRQSRGQPDPERRPTLFRNNLSISQAIHDATSRKAATIEKLRRRASEGLNARKFVMVRDRDGARSSVEVPDQAARREWALVCARLENLLPGKGGDPSYDTLPHDVAKAEQLERTQESDLQHEVSRMSAADRCQVSEYFLKIEHYQDRIRRQVIVAKLGKSVEEFEAEVDQEVRSEMKQFVSGLDSKPATSCDNS